MSIYRRAVLAILLSAVIGAAGQQPKQQKTGPSQPRGVYYINFPPSY